MVEPAPQSLAESHPLTDGAVEATRSPEFRLLAGILAQERCTTLEEMADLVADALVEWKKRDRDPEHDEFVEALRAFSHGRVQGLMDLFSPNDPDFRDRAAALWRRLVEFWQQTGGIPREIVDRIDKWLKKAVRDGDNTALIELANELRPVFARTQEAETARRAEGETAQSAERRTIASIADDLPPSQREVLESIRTLPDDAFAEAEFRLATLFGQPMTKAFAHSFTSVLREKKWGVVCETCGKPSVVCWISKERYAQGGAGHFSHTGPAPHGSLTKIRKMQFVKKLDRRLRRRT